MLKSRWSLILIGIILLASILRFYRLGSTPQGLEWDEVALGYDAYSILKTGRDQFGQFLPLTFRSIDDYKPPLYIYAAVPAVALFGLTEFATRFPSAFYGILAVLGTFWLAKLIFSNIPSLRRHTYSLSILSSFLLTMSPWHLQFSRAAFEVNLSVCVTIFAVVFFLKGIQNPRFLLLSALFFGIDLFSYHSVRVISPLLLLSLFILFNKYLPAKKYLVAFVLIWGVFFTAFIPILFSKDAQIRFSATNIFKPGARYLNDRDLETVFLDKRIQDRNAGYELDGKIFHNQRLVYTDYETLKKVFNNYLSHFNFEFLFIKGDAPLHHAPGFGLLYIVELPFIIIGLIYILKKGVNRYTLILLLWMIFVPIPSAITRNAPHAVRTEIFLPTFQIFTALGIILILILLKRQMKIIQFLGTIIIVSIFMINFIFYLHQYYVHTNYELSGNWMYTRKEAVELTEKLKVNYDTVIVSPRIEDPLIFWLFYTKYPPEKYLKKGGTISGGFADERNHFDKYEFRYFDYDHLPKDRKLLLVGTTNTTPGDFPGHANIIRTLYNLNGSVSLELAENKK